MRISRHQMWMEIAVVASKRSTCFRRNVGAVIVRDRNIISIGYNGPASGAPHCEGRRCVPDGGLGCIRALHAERNALARTPTMLVGVPGCILYTTESPCLDCAQMIVDSRISALYYLHLYRVTEGVDLVAKHMPVFRMTPSGMLVDHKTGELIDETAGNYHASATPGD